MPIIHGTGKTFGLEGKKLSGASAHFAKMAEMAKKMKSQKGKATLGFAKHKTDVEGQKSYKQKST